MIQTPKELRILVADDNPTILDIFRVSFTGKHLRRKTGPRSVWRNFQLPDGRSCAMQFDLCLCSQADEAVSAVARSIEEKKPFSVAFLDIRMPPGEDGIWAAENIRALDPRVEFVIITAYSDVDPRDISLRVLPSHKLLYIQKPFGPMEIYQFATALGSKWLMENELHHAQLQLEDRIRKRTAELVKTNEHLLREISDREKVEKALRHREKELEAKSSELEETNAALKVLLKKIQEDKLEFEESVMGNVRQRISPQLKKLRKSLLNSRQTKQLDILETALEDITSPFLRNLSSLSAELTPTEIQVADMVREGKTSKEIAELIPSSVRAVEFHRHSIRSKLGILKQRVNLRAYLQSLKS